MEELEGMTSAQVSESMAFSRIEPLLGRRIDLAAAMITSVLGSLIAGLVGGEPVRMQDLVPEWEKITPGKGGPSLETQARNWGVQMRRILRDPGRKNRPKSQKKTPTLRDKPKSG